MRKNLTIFLILLGMLVSTRPAHAQKFIRGGKDLPLELTLMITHLHNYDTNAAVKLMSVIYAIDTYARSLSKEDIFIIGKVEIYKTLLRNSGPAVTMPIDGVTLGTLQLALTKTQDNFLKWFILALLKDSQDLLANPLYHELILQKNNKLKLEKNDYRKLEKKSELIQYWVSKINPSTQDFPIPLVNALRPKLFEALFNVQRGYMLMANEASMEPKVPVISKESELKFFKIVDSTPPPPPPAPSEEKPKSVEDILAPITDTRVPNLPKPSQENWLQEENTPGALQNLPKPSNDADWLQDF